MLFFGWSLLVGFGCAWLGVDNQGSEAEQFGDTIGWDIKNRTYILAHRDDC